MEFIPELLRYMCLEEGDDQLANDILRSSLIQENKFRLEGTFSELRDTDCPQNFREILNSKSVVSLSGIPSNIYLIAQKHEDDLESSCDVYLTFDFDIDYWRKVGSMPFFPVCFVQIGHEVLMLNDERDSLVFFNIVTEQFRNMNFISKGGRGYSIAALNGCIYIIGGFYQGTDMSYRHNNELTVIEMFNPSTQVWTLVRRMNAMVFIEAFTINGSMYAIGYNTDDEMNNEDNTRLTVQIYDPSTDIWSNVAGSRPFGTYFCTIEFRGHLYFFGWKVYFDGPFSWVSTDEYDPENDAWIPMPHLPFCYCDTKAIVLNDTLIVYVMSEFHEIDPPVCWDAENRNRIIIDDSSPLRLIHMYTKLSITEPSVKYIVKRNSHQTKRYIKSSIV